MYKNSVLTTQKTVCSQLWIRPMYGLTLVRGIITVCSKNRRKYFGPHSAGLNTNLRVLISFLYGV